MAQNICTTKLTRRWSPVWKISEQEFSDLVKNSKTTTEVLSFFGLKIRAEIIEQLNRE
jgi:hypothetical protein